MLKKSIAQLQVAAVVDLSVSLIRGIADGFSPEELARVIDNTMLKPTAPIDEVLKSIEETRRYGFKCLVLSPGHAVHVLSKGLAEGVNICSVVGFPMGYSTTRIKTMEAEELLSHGVKEVDIVMNLQLFKSGMYECVLSDVAAVVDIARRYGAIAKVIIESPLLSYSEKVRAVEIAIDSGAHFVKTSTGILSKTPLHDVYILVEAARGRIKVKAAGGFSSAIDTLIAIAIGAERIGTSSAVQIVKEFQELKSLMKN
ncbi:MAG: deoxyribose-phosphate aldolase [Ignisphaera sp.]|nr:deoxyribose-phosphate aldolase [Ignisphaera sp.]